MGGKILLKFRSDKPICAVRRNDNLRRYTIILNHSRGWGGKPIGSPRDSRVAEMSENDMRARLFYFLHHNIITYLVS